MAEKKFVVFLTEVISPLRRQSLAEAVSPSLRVPIEKVVALLSRPVGPLTKPSSETETMRILRVLQDAGVPVELRDSQGASLAAAASSAVTQAGAAVQQSANKALHNVQQATAQPARATQSPVQAGSSQDVSSQDVSSQGIGGAQAPQMDGRTVFDNVGADYMPSVPPMPNFQQDASADSFDDDFDDFDMPKSNVASFSTPNLNAHAATASTVSTDDFGDVDFDDDDDDFGDIDVPMVSAWDSTLDEDEHNRLIAEREAAQAREAQGMTQGMRAKSKQRGSFRFPILYKLLLTVLLPLLVFFGLTFYFVNNRVVQSAEQSLVQIGDNLAINLAADMNNYLQENNESISSAEAVYYFTKKLNAISQSLHRSVGIHFTDSQGVRNGGTWNPEVTQSTAFDRFETAFTNLAERTLQVADFGDDDEKRDRTLAQRVERVSGAGDDFYVVAAPLENDAGTVQVIIAERDVLANARTVINPILYTAIIILLIALFIAFLLAFTLSRNLRRLSRIAERISLGDLEEPVTVRGNDEIRDLSEAFESMRQSLQAAIERISRRDKEARRR